jgi:hypothetical protein
MVVEGSLIFVLVSLLRFFEVGHEQETSKFELSFLYLPILILPLYFLIYVAHNIELGEILLKFIETEGHFDIFFHVIITVKSWTY